jgi:hypothetical protein
VPQSKGQYRCHLWLILCTCGTSLCCKTLIFSYISIHTSIPRYEIYVPPIIHSFITSLKYWVERWSATNLGGTFYYLFNIINQDNPPNHHHLRQSFLNNQFKTLANKFNDLIHIRLICKLSLHIKLNDLIRIHL